jgi:hypothetical protein
MPDAAFVLMNCDLIAVPLQLDRGNVVTVYCGERWAHQLRSEPAQSGLAGAGYARRLGSTPVGARLDKLGMQVVNPATQRI